MLALAAALVVAVPGGAVDGVATLGRTVPQVERALGAPTSVERYPRRRDLVYGSARRPRLEVIFAGPSTEPSRQRAWAILVADPRAAVVGLGRVLAVAPRTLERRLRATGLHEARPYRCDAKGCFGTFLDASRTRRVIYGVQHGSRFLGVQVWPNPSRSP